ncbi:MAG TPA: fumarylacetoacetate hydrolase family protein [Spirochaetia bacterium]|nr:fumarylacetoacetate hydrolase family protein [Spirochaetia bacterium]
MIVTLPIANNKGSITLNPTKIIALGLNYREHIAESQSVSVKGFDQAIPSEPVLFCKTPNALLPPGEPIVLPAIVKGYNFADPRTDYEGELAFVIKKRCKNIEPKDAYQFILGFTCLNDVSQRNIQNGDRSGWFRGKSFDTFAPVGPVVVLTEDLKNPMDLSIRTRLNGKTVQDSRTSAMIFSIPELLSFISRNMTLEEGDVVSTGTPSGVGAIKQGDVVEVEIEGIGVLRNPVREEDA